MARNNNFGNLMIELVYINNTLKKEIHIGKNLVQKILYVNTISFILGN